MSTPAPRPESDRHEAPGERLDRQWNELLQELRVTQTGVQILAGFLLILPFQTRFAELGAAQQWLYLCAVTAAALSMICIVAPVIIHRQLFQSHRKDTLVQVGDRLARIGMGLLGVTITLVVTLVFGVVVGPTAMIIAGAGTALLCLLLWFGLPMIMGRSSPNPYRAGPSH